MLGGCKATENRKRSGEFLEFNERPTKTRTGSDHDVRLVPPKKFSTDGTERDPVVLYKLFATKRPEQMNQEDTPLLSGCKQRFEDRDACNKRLVQVQCCWGKQA